MFPYQPNNQATQPPPSMFPYSNSIPQPAQPPKPFTPTPPVIPAPIVNTQQTQSNLFVPTNQPSAHISSQPTQSYQEVRPSTAWNDPPMVQQKVKAPALPKDIGIDQTKLFQPSNYSAPSYGQPLLAPIPQPTQIPNSNGFATNPPVINNNTNNFFNPLNNRPNVQPNVGFNPIPQNVAAPPSGNTRNSPVQKVTAPVIEKPVKQPIPGEYQNIQIIFDDLLKRCLDLTNAPTQKRKLEDVAKKLELLYDKLRDRTVS